MPESVSRREFLATAALASGLPASDVRDHPPALQLTTFTAEVTPPIGHPCMGGRHCSGDEDR
jgi:hypothetical protein